MKHEQTGAPPDRQKIGKKIPHRISQERVRKRSDDPFALQNFEGQIEMTHHKHQDNITHCSEFTTFPNRKSSLKRWLENILRKRFPRTHRGTICQCVTSPANWKNLSMLREIRQAWYQRVCFFHVWKSRCGQLMNMSIFVWRLICRHEVSDSFGATLPNSLVIEPTKLGHYRSVTSLCRPSTTILTQFWTVDRPAPKVVSPTVVWCDKKPFLMSIVTLQPISIPHLIIW